MVARLVARRQVQCMHEEVADWLERGILKSQGR